MSSKEETEQHTVIFVTKEDLASPSKVKLPARDKPTGLILDDGSINWSCPCLGGMTAGPCGVQFRDAFSCFHYSEAEPKGSDCMEAFSKMQECMQQYPKLYGPKDNNNDDDDELFDIDQTKPADQAKVQKYEGSNSNVGSSNNKEAEDDTNINPEMEQTDKMAQTDKKLKKKD